LQSAVHTERIFPDTAFFHFYVWSSKVLGRRPAAKVESARKQIDSAISRSRILLLVALTWLAIVACSTKDSAPAPARPPSEAGAAPSHEADESAAVRALGKEYLDLVVEISPERATELGFHQRDTELDDRSAAGFARALEREQALLDSIGRRFPSEPRDQRARTDLAMLKGALEVDIRLKRERRPLETQPDLYASPLNAIFLMTARDYAPASERAKNVLSRLEKIPAMIEAAKTNLKRPPRVWTEIGIERARSAKSFLGEQREFLQKSLPTEPARVGAALKVAADAYQDYAGFLQKQLLPRSDGQFAAGKDLFGYLLLHDYFLREGPDELYAMGEKLVSEIDAQLTEVARRIDPKSKSWAEVVTRLKANHPRAEALVDSYRKEVGRVRKFLVEKDVVEFPPGEELDVIETPAFLRTTITAAYDQPPPFDPVTKGFFFVTPIDLSRPKLEQEQMLREHDHGDQVDTAVHEAYPGHHLQLSFARRHPSLIRKALGPAIFAEGWALYAEELMAELGYYSDEERLFQLEWALVRAARILIDVGLHVRGMSFDEAVSILTDKVRLGRPLALSEVKRYTQSPTQPLSYMTGRQMILKLRERYKARAGAGFTLKRFHSELLTRGTVAPSLLGREIFGD